jgi:hypothetical protein
MRQHAHVWDANRGKNPLEPGDPGTVRGRFLCDEDDITNTTLLRADLLHDPLLRIGELPLAQFGGACDRWVS